MNKLKGLKENRRFWLVPLTFIALLSTSLASQATAIHDAAKTGDLDQVQRLVIKGVDVNAKAVRGETPLIIAAIAGNGEIVNYLLQRGADINARSAAGLTALHAAAYAGHSDIVSLLVAKGATVNDSANRFGTTPLLLAAEENHIDTVSSLLAHGADVNAVEMNGISATSKAGWRENWELLTLLLANGGTCQPVDIAGDWLLEECTTRANTN